MGEVVFHIFITALVTVFPTPVALMRLEKNIGKHQYASQSE